MDIPILPATDQSDSDPDYEPPATRRKQSDTVTLEVPRKGMLKGSAELAVRSKFSVRQQTAMTAQFIKLGGGSLKPFSLSASTAQRHRKSEIEERAMKIKNKFIEEMPEFLVLHWDAKVIKYENRQQLEERLAVVASIPTPNPKERFQFLGAPRMPDGTGASMLDVTAGILNEWSIQEGTILGLSVDTTASNTGWKSGSATLVERHLGKAKLWIPCRHHIGERHVTHANDEVRGKYDGKPTSAKLLHLDLNNVINVQ